MRGIRSPLGLDARFARGSRSNDCPAIRAACAPGPHDPPANIRAGGSKHMLSIYHREPNANSGQPILVVFEKGVEFERRYVKSGDRDGVPPSPCL
jgi:hypothetical protein